MKPPGSFPGSLLGLFSCISKSSLVCDRSEITPENKELPLKKWGGALPGPRVSEDQDRMILLEKLWAHRRAKTLVR
jgi:hypothetical protein